MRRFLLFLLVAAACGGGFYYYHAYGLGAPPSATAPATTAGGGGGKGGQGGEARPQPVILRAVERRPMPVRIATIGTVQPLATVAIRSRIESVIETAHFLEGQEVRRGDPLFTLDARGAEAQVRQAEANLVRDQAQFDRARADVRRLEDLLRRGVASPQQYDTALANAHALEGTVSADLAAIDGARLTLSYTRIAAPIDGRTGAILIKPGNVVRPADSGALVTVTQLRPIAVVFSLPERELPAIRAAAAAAVPIVRVVVPNDPGPPIEGALTFLDNAIDIATGTIQLKATFENADTRLWPGQFVEVMLILRVDPDALTIVADAIQTGQGGLYVYVARSDSARDSNDVRLTAEVRPVKVARIVEGIAVIAEGLEAGERVVVDGQSRLGPGVRITERPAGDRGDGARGDGAKGTPRISGDPAAAAGGRS